MISKRYMTKKAMFVSTNEQVTIVQMYGNYVPPSDDTLKMFAAFKISISFPKIRDISDKTIDM